MKASRSFWRVLPLLLIIGGLAAAYGLGFHRDLTFAEMAARKDALEADLAALGIWGPLLYAVIYMIVTSLAVPVAGVFTVFGGFLFGWIAAGIIVAISATLSATLVFLAARSALGDALRNRARGRIAQLSAGFEENAFAYLIVLRMVPLFSFFVVNVAPAFFKVRLSTFIATTFLGILPGTFTLAFLGQGIDSVVEAAETAGRTASLADLVTPRITLALGALAALAIIAAALRTLWSWRIGSGTDVDR